MELKDFRHLVGFLEKQMKTGSCYVAHARLELGIFLCLLPKSYPNIIGMHLGNTTVMWCTEHKDWGLKDLGVLWMLIAVR